MRQIGLMMRRMRISSAYNVLVMLICGGMTFYAVYFFRDKPNRSVPHTERTVQNETSKRNKVIHLYSFPFYYELKAGSQHFKDCPINTCEYSDKPEEMSDSDAIIFFTHHTWPKLLEKRRDQVWIFFSVESPVHSDNGQYGGPGWENTFNWTMSYRLDSDIKFGYGDVVKNDVKQTRDYYAITKGKTKQVAWFVSNCNTQSKRMKYVRLLQKHISVDIFGSCGNFKCSRAFPKECRDMLEKKYKFYLSFENSICQDYVTEKLFNMMKLDIVPIARGGGNFSAVLPERMAIDTADFTSVKALADHLKYLDSNTDQYVSYLKWKDSYHIVEPQPFPHCSLCERVHHPEKWANTYKNVADWWSKGRCRDPTDLIP